MKGSAKAWKFGFFASSLSVVWERSDHGIFRYSPSLDSQLNLSVRGFADDLTRGRFFRH